MIAADDAGEAEFLAGSHRLRVMSRKLRGERMPLPHPETAAAQRPTDPDERRAFEQATAGFIIGDRLTVRRDLAEFQARTGADEVIISTPVHDHGARQRTYALAAGATA